MFPAFLSFIVEKVPRAERAPAPRAERYYGTANLLADLAAAKGIPTLKSPAEGWKGVQSQDTLIWKGNPNKEAFQQRLRLGFSQGQFGLGEASGRRRAEQEYMSWMPRGVRFPSTARFCVTGWGTGCKLSSPLLSFPLFFFHPLFFLFLLETKERFRLFFLIKAPIPCRFGGASPCWCWRGTRRPGESLFRVPRRPHRDVLFCSESSALSGAPRGHSGRSWRS